jgi:DNA-binding transcriptional MerR regulator
LPKPHKVHQTSALYDEAFVAQVQLIKQLQRHRYLPLRVIRDLLGRGAVKPEDMPRAQPIADMLDTHLPAPLLAARKRTYREPQVLRMGLVRRDLRDLERAGVLTPQVVQGVKRYSELDGRIARALGALRMTGMEKLGFGTAEIVQLAEMVRLLVKQEIRIFTEKVLGKLSAEEIVALIDRILPVSSQLFDSLRAKAQLDELALVRAR